MKKFILLLVFALSSVSSAGCSLSHSGSFEAISTSCEKPPKVLEWSGKTYELKAENTTLQPGMKYGYMKCDQGKLTLGDADDPITVYSVGDPRTNHDIILFGKWGSALYSIAASSN